MAEEEVRKLVLPYDHTQLPALLASIKNEDELRTFVLEYAEAKGTSLTENEVNTLIANYITENNIGSGNSQSGTGLTPEQAQKLAMLLTDGNGEKYLGNDGAYHNIPSGSENAGTSIDDTTTSNASTWSSSKIASEINNKTVSQSQINSAVNNYLTENPVSGVTNTLSDKNIVVFGDSISDTTNNITKWCQPFYELADCAFFKSYARGSCTMTNNSNTAYDVTTTNTVQGGNNVIWNQVNRLKVDTDNNTVPTPDLIIIMAGTNDATQGKTVGSVSTVFTTQKNTFASKFITQIDDFVSSSRKVIDMIREYYPSCEIILISPIATAYNATAYNYITDLRGIIEQIADNTGCHYISGGEFGITYYDEGNGNHKYLADGIHPNEAGGNRMGKIIFDRISTMPFMLAKSLGYAELEEQPSVTTYTVTKTASNASVTGNTSVEENASYSATVSANTGYTLNTVTVTMGGEDITSTAYSNGSISIASVTGNVVITVTTTANTYTVTKNATNCTITGNASATHGSSYTATITADSGYTLQTPTITMGGNTLSGVYSNGTVTIPNVTGNIAITASAIEASQEVHATAISLSPSTVSFTTAGDTSTITPTLTPNDTTDTITSWVSSDTNVATVSNGVITSVANGSATITATTSNGLTATVSVTVSISQGGDGFVNHVKTNEQGRTVIEFSALESDMPDITLTEGHENCVIYKYNSDNWRYLDFGAGTGKLVNGVVSILLDDATTGINRFKYSNSSFVDNSTRYGAQGSYIGADCGMTVYYSTLNLYADDGETVAFTKNLG